MKIQSSRIQFSKSGKANSKVLLKKADSVQPWSDAEPIIHKKRQL